MNRTLYPEKTDPSISSAMCKQGKQRRLSLRKIEPLHLQANNNLKRSRSVQFGEIQECSLDSLPYNDEDKAALFYTQAELRKLKKADISAKREAEENPEAVDHIVDEEEISFRGLEHCLDTSERKQHIREYVQSVVGIHLEQREMGYFDDFELYVIARHKSKKDRKHAQRMASLDSRDIMDYSDQSDASSSALGSRRSLKRWVSGQFSKLTRSNSSTSSRLGGLRRCNSQ
jgi:hypothetical protein